MENLNEIAKKSRKIALKMIAEGKGCHVGGCFSVMDILVSIYFDVFKDELTPEKYAKNASPKVILSKGHTAAALYSVLYLKGFLEESDISKYYKNDGLPGHVDSSINGICFTTGSLGHGLAVGAGIALANKLNSKQMPTIVVMSDGECQAGSVWEAANFAVMKKLNNLIAVVDYNKLQAYDRTDVIGSNFKEKFSAFGMNVIEADGHDFSSLRNAFSNAKSSDKPTVIIVHTIKGKGIRDLEDKLESHYKTPTGNEMDD